jgi:hypothetical protein
MQGLLELLQGGGQAVNGGWGIIIDLLTSVPASMVPQDALENLELTPSPSWEDPPPTVPSIPQTPDKSNPEVEDLPLESSKAWPDIALQIAFSCMKLIVDDFLEFLQIDVIKNVVTCLSMFSAQLSDVNVSLTSVEMLWKVTDFIMTSSRQKGDEATTTAVLDVMLRRLLFLAMDQRPEVSLLFISLIPHVRSGIVPPIHSSLRSSQMQLSCLQVNGGVLLMMLFFLCFLGSRRDPVWQ